MEQIERKTKYFGTITIEIDSDGNASSDVIYEGRDLRIFFSDYSSYGDKIDTCWAMLDHYAELDAMARKAIVANFAKDDTVSYYFECHFDMLEKEDLVEVFGVDELQKMDIRRVVEQLPYPNLLFGIDNNVIELSVDYMVAEDYSDEILSVKVDEQLQLQCFSHES